MTKTLTEQWREGMLKTGWYYTKHDDGKIYIWLCFKDDCSYIENPEVKEILAPVPSYDKVKEMNQKIERLEFDNEVLEMAHNEGKEINAELVSKNDELVQKIHILNEQNTKQYNGLCEEIKKNNILEKKLAIATKALKEYADQDKWSYCSEDIDYFYSTEPGYRNAEKALKEMDGVK